MNIKEIINQSISWRPQEAQTIRLFSGVSDGIEGLIMDMYGPFILATLYNQELVSKKEEILSIISEIYPQKATLLKIRNSTDSNKFHYEGNSLYQKENIYTCNEDGSVYEIHCDPKHDFGLYLDTKAARNLLSKISKDRTVLNLFSYTCAFGIIAMNNGARSVTNIDPNKSYLDWGKKNADLNNVVFKRYSDTTQDYLKRHIRRLESGKDASYDITVVDPPAFLVGRGTNRLARNMWDEWFSALKISMSSRLIIIINDKSLGREQNLFKFFQKGLGENIKISLIDQTPDIVGQQLVTNDDPFYFNPAIFYIQKVETT